MCEAADAPAVAGIVVVPGGGRSFEANRLVLKVGPEAGAQFGVMEGLLPPGAGPAPHRHQRYEEAFYVLEGEIEYRVGDEWITATAGACVFAPPGLTHGFRNRGTTDARHLVITAPAEALEMVEAVHSVSPEQIAQVLARYDTELVDGS